MSRSPWHIAFLALAALAAACASSPAWGQARPYIGFVYPAGGQQGTTVQVRLGGQNLDYVNGVLVTGSGVHARVVEYLRRLNNQEQALLAEQLRELKPKASKPGQPAAPSKPLDEATQKLVERIERRMTEYVNTPACNAIASLVFIEVSIDAGAEPGRRELRLVTARGISNPLVFYVGQSPESVRKPMLSAQIQVLGKEELALRKRPDDEIERQVALPCVANGQIASGEVNRYRFAARKGQRLVLSVAARDLVPYIADAVPGWFQPVVSVRDARGREVAYNDDYRFKPDPVLMFTVPEDGEYVVSITDALFRGREDFVYRMTIGETPFVTNIFPLGGRVGAAGPVSFQGWNVEGAKIAPPPADAGPGVHYLVAKTGGMVSNAVPFALDTLPECLEREPNNTAAAAQTVQLPIIVNGRINRPDDWDVFQFAGKADDEVVVEVTARRLDSPLDSIVRLTDAAGKIVAVNDDNEDLGSGLNTHHADSYLRIKLPADGTYRVWLGDTARGGGDAYGYRLRIGPPRPDFALRVVPSSIALRSKSNAAVTVYAIRKDGFAGPIKFSLKGSPEGFVLPPTTLPPNQEMVRLALRTTLTATDGPIDLAIEGTATINGEEVTRTAVPAEDRMQAFLWRHLVPVQDLKVLVFDPSAEPRPKRVSPFPLPKL